MAGARFIVEVDDSEVVAAIARLTQPGTGDLMPRIGEYLLRTTKARFESQTAPDGSPWSPLSKRYQKRKKYNADKVLTLRGYLRRGIRYQVDGDRSVLVGTNSPYGAIHQKGGTIEMRARQATLRTRSVAGRILFASKKHKRAQERNVTIPAHEVNMPARPYLGVSSKDQVEIGDIVRAWIRERVAG